MTTVGIICEYNPFHKGHAKQLRQIRGRFGEDCRIVCLMSGNFVQRGEPAIFDKLTRAEAAVACGADVVLELPVVYALSSAEGFAAGGVKLLSLLRIDVLCFGCESGDGNLVMSTAEALLQPSFDAALKTRLSTGISYASARAQALASLYPQGAEVLQRPNDILAVEYCKAILRQQSPISVFAIPREGDYHAEIPEEENPSASAVRTLLTAGEEASFYIPAPAYAHFENAPLHTLQAGERGIMARLHTMSEVDFSRLPYGSEGLWRRFYHAAREESDTQSIINAVKTKRYARSRISRMLLCAALGLTEGDMAREPEYVRILAFSQPGRAVLRGFRTDCALPLISATERVRRSDFYNLEQRCERMYSLFQI